MSSKRTSYYNKDKTPTHIDVRSRTLTNHNTMNQKDTAASLVQQILRNKSQNNAAGNMLNKQQEKMVIELGQI